MSEHSERMRYCSCHEKIKFKSLSLSEMFFLLYRHTDNGIFNDFPKISDHFQKISEDSLKLVRRSHERCRAFSEGFRRPYLSNALTNLCEDYRRLLKTFKEDPKMFRLYTN